MEVRLTYNNHQNPQPITQDGKHVVGFVEVAGQTFNGTRIDTTVGKEVEEPDTVEAIDETYGLFSRVVPFL